MLSKSLTAVVLILLLSATPSSAQTVDTLFSAKDNTLFESPTGNLSNGAGEYFFAGRTTQLSNSIRRGLIAFDVAAVIPDLNTIDSVKLVLSMSREISGIEPVRLHRVTADWGEGSSNALGGEGGGTAPSAGDATWLHTFHNTATWTTPGGDFIGTPSAAINVNAIGLYTWGSTAAMVSDVTAWRDTPSTNFGWMLIGNESAITTAKRFDSRQNLLPASHPKLIVYHTAPVGPCCTGTTGDFNNDSQDADPVDLSYFVDFLFSGGPGPVCTDEADVNGDNDKGDPVDLSFLVDFLFSGGASPAPCP